ncbi:hypothetical protein V2I01_30800 [Micromonospora sp. BRA006-A]|nr:hypothetical protein [Micromonospora sp. BRA006-A]
MLTRALSAPATPTRCAASPRAGCGAWPGSPGWNTRSSGAAWSTCRTRPGATTGTTRWAS